MGYGLMVYAVDTVQLGDLIGCGDYKKLVKIEDTGWVQNEIDRFDEDFDTYSYDEEKHVMPVMHQALTDIVMGTVPDRGYYSSYSAPAIYGYAYLLLCKVYCYESLHNGYWCPVPFDLAGQVDDIYMRGGLEFGVVSSLVEDGPMMMKLPGYPDFPLLGHVMPEDVQKVYTAMQKLDIEKIVEGQNEWMRGAIREAWSWYARVVEINEQVKRDGVDANFALVGAFH